MNFSAINKLMRITAGFIIMAIILSLSAALGKNKVLAKTTDKEEVKKAIEDIFEKRNKAIIDGDLEFIQSIYNTNTQYGTWAYEYEQRKVKYVRNWAEKQGVKFTEINPKVVFKKISGSGSRFSSYLICSTEYKYVYENQPEVINTSRIGTYHTINLQNKDGAWIIEKEWYNDPFADSLNLDNIKADNIKQHILSQESRDSEQLNERRIRAVDYARQFCGAASEEQYGFKYNPKYRNYNPQGGDCANFASQILFEGAKFKKNGSWNYDGRGATRAWLNADGFKSYMLYSGRASLIAYGDYDKVYKASYKLLPGDFVAYEKKGDITHISMVTGSDSRGYTLVTCHNTDRYNVPWDLGWSDKKIKFWLVRVHY
ncbi:hypothetical protein HMPREF1982_02838 [Clostridiales bacterium oral taxon 876 str. F0540]|nr:hypothetical protein HMPREF1982_02838 [Clostridiales bacterium oral taxon 876 str. F0540]